MNSEEQEIITDDGEVLSTTLVTVDHNLVGELARAEIDQAITTAHRFPRSLTHNIKNILTLATIDEETAQECIYALPRKGKPIRGPSIRLAEIIASQWRNCRVAAHVIEVNRIEKYVAAEGIFHDLETNVATRVTVRRRLSDKGGRLLSDDMIIVTGNAACSIAKRNAILGGVPKGVWNKAYQACEQIIKGDLKTLSERRGRAIAAMAQWGVKPEQIFAALGVAGEEEITLEHIPTLQGIFSAIKNGEATVEEIFSTRGPAIVTNINRIANPLDDAPPAPQPPAASSAPSSAGAGGDEVAIGSPAKSPPTPSPEAGPPPADGAGGAGSASPAPPLPTEYDGPTTDPLDLGDAPPRRRR